MFVISLINLFMLVYNGFRLPLWFILLLWKRIMNHQSSSYFPTKKPLKTLIIHVEENVDKISIGHFLVKKVFWFSEPNIKTLPVTVKWILLNVKGQYKYSKVFFILTQWEICRDEPVLYRSQISEEGQRCEAL